MAPFPLYVQWRSEFYQARFHTNFPHKLNFRPFPLDKTNLISIYTNQISFVDMI